MTCRWLSRPGCWIDWILRSDPKKETIGFVKASELRRFVMSDDWD